MGTAIVSRRPLFGLLFGTAFPAAAPLATRRTPAQAGLDPAAIQRAIEIAVTGESRSPGDLAFNHLRTFGREPLGDAAGPFTVRGAQTGLIVHREWRCPLGRRDDPERL